MASVTPKRGLRLLAACAAPLMLAGSVTLAPPAAAQDATDPPLVPPTVKASSAILVDAATGTVLWEKSARTRRPIASTTKIMTAALVIESGRLAEQVTFSENARKTPYANFHAQPGEQVPMRDLLYAIMLRSSNDGCVAAGEHLAGSARTFAQMMTARARQIGALDTNFVTTNGLYDKDHYSTAFDLAVMARHAIQYPLFNEVVATKSFRVQRSKNHKDVLIQNHNKFLSRYSGADGIKTGYVRQSGRCLVASATHAEGGNPWRLVAVVLNSADTYGDSAALIEWGKQNFQPVFFARAGEQITMASVSGGASGSVPLVTECQLSAVIRRIPGKNIQREIRLGSALDAPVSVREVGGTLVGMIDGNPVAEVPLVAAAPVRRVWLAGMASWTGWTLLLAGIALGPRYARAIAKGARRRRRRVATRRRTVDYEW